TRAGGAAQGHGGGSPDGQLTYGGTTVSGRQDIRAGVVKHCEQGPARARCPRVSRVHPSNSLTMRGFRRSASGFRLWAFGFELSGGFGLWPVGLAFSRLRSCLGLAPGVK